MSSASSRSKKVSVGGKAGRFSSICIHLHHVFSAIFPCANESTMCAMSPFCAIIQMPCAHSGPKTNRRASLITGHLKALARCAEPIGSTIESVYVYVYVYVYVAWIYIIVWFYMIVWCDMMSYYIILQLMTYTLTCVWVCYLDDSRCAANETWVCEHQKDLEKCARRSNWSCHWHPYPAAPADFVSAQEAHVTQQCH